MAEQPAETSPPSPPSSPVKLSDCIADLLHFTLSASSLEIPPLGLSQDYRARLLQIDEAEPRPLYKHLAFALERCLLGRSFSIDRRGSPMDSVRVDATAAKAREEEWNQLIAEKGSEMLSMLEGVDFELHVQEPYFSLLRSGAKTVEGRCAAGDCNRIAPGSLLLVNGCLLLKVEHVNRHGSFAEMLRSEGLPKVLPGVETIDEGVRVYRRFYTEEKETSNGVLAIYVSKSASQPYISSAGILSGLGHDGVGALLGMARTVGTVPDALPPPRSSLVASATKRHRPDVEGCNLTDAARALAKHVDRSSQGWWGRFSGSDADKNRVASEAVDRVLDGACWMNVHLVQPHGCVFEARVGEGYGARWSSDGEKFVGFLEPYTEEGYSKGWKH